MNDYEEFENYMAIRDNVSDLIAALEEIEDRKIRSENLEYAIIRLLELKAEEE